MNRTTGLFNSIINKQMAPLIEREKEHNYTFYTASCSVCEKVIVQPTFDKEFCHREARWHNEGQHEGLRFAAVYGFNHYPGARELGLI